MPRYYFHVDDGHSTLDDEGTEFPGLKAARIAAVRLAGAILGERAEAFWDEEQWSLRVTDDAGLTLFSLEVVATQAPALRGPAAAAA
jgi:hypothetical protein